jgi:competence protein ComEA
MMPRTPFATRAATGATLAVAVLLASTLGNRADAQTAAPKTTTAPTTKAKAANAAKRLDINKATAEELIETLPGVGPATARKIVDGRPYKSVDDLEKAGVPARTLEAIRPMIMVAPATTKAEPKAKAKASTTSTASGKVNLNTASAEELETLPGVGPARASEIIAGRPYKSINDLEKIKGLGAARIEALREHLTVAAPVQPSAPAAETTRAATTGGKVNLNTASVEELETLPGVGPARAKEIIEGRPYKTVDDLEKIKGLGATRIEALRAHVTAGAMASAPAAKSATAKTAEPSKTALAPGQRININKASQAELERLFGIGPIKSQAIIDHRAETPFKTIEDIMKVKGIKEGEFAKIKDQIKVD